MITRFDLITIGNISRNRYWGEPDDAARRPAICTCTLVRGKNFNLLVDPSLTDEGRMVTELDRRTGLKPADIHIVFLTHGHGDHHFGLKHFPAARWLAPAPVAAAINQSKQYAKPLEAAGGSIENIIDVIPTPGHTLDHHSLRFDLEGKSVVIAADAVMTRDFFLDRRGYFNSANLELASQTISQLATLADIIVPGHDNYFLNGRGAGSSQ